MKKIKRNETKKWKEIREENRRKGEILEEKKTS